MKLVFYGTTGAIQSVDNTNVSFLVIEEGSTILVDTAGNPAQSLLKTGVHASDLDMVILTHFH